MNTSALRVAREALGLTQTDLAKKSGIAQPELSRWEKGLRTPSHEQAEHLSTVLEIPVDFLLGDERVAQPVHRTRRSERKRTEKMVNGRLELARRAASRLLADIDIEPAFPFPSFDDQLSVDPEEAAYELRRVWRIPPGPIDDLTAIVESAGVVVLPVDFGASNIPAAYVFPRGDHRWCFLNTHADDGAPVRFDLAHELGHALLHWERFDASRGKDAESEAHRFASALLMPADDIRGVLSRTRPRLEEFVALRRTWGVSIQALVRRARDLGYLSPETYTRLYKQISARGWRKSEPGKLPLERPALLAEALELHRSDHGYSDDDLVRIGGLTSTRLADLLPDYFTLRTRPTATLTRIK